MIACDRCLGCVLCCSRPNCCPCFAVVIFWQSQLLSSLGWAREISLLSLGHCTLRPEVIATQLFGKRSGLKILTKELEWMEGVYREQANCMPKSLFLHCSCLFFICQVPKRRLCKLPLWTGSVCIHRYSMSWQACLMSHEIQTKQGIP